MIVRISWGMVKWADYLISEVQYNNDHTRIINVKQHIDNDDSIGSSSIVTKLTVITNIRNENKKYHTIRKNTDGKWVNGDNVIAYVMGNDWFIRTDGNKTEKDNLGQLPEF